LLLKPSLEPTQRFVPFGMEWRAGSQMPDGASNSSNKRRPYTRLACFSCKEKHQKCDGSQPCINCSSKGLECRYREERNRRRDKDSDLHEEITELQAQVDQWKDRYLTLKKFVDETLLPGSHPTLNSPGSHFLSAPTYVMHDPNLYNPMLNPFLDYTQLAGLFTQVSPEQQVWNPTNANGLPTFDK